MATNITTGPFVNERGQLDLSRTTVEDTMFYLCTGVDVAGASASQLFRVEVVPQGCGCKIFSTLYTFSHLQMTLCYGCSGT